MSTASHRKAPPEDAVREVATEVVLIPRPPTAPVGGGLKARTQFATILLSVESEGGLVGESYLSLESIAQARGLAAIMAEACQAVVGVDAFARARSCRAVVGELHDLLPGSGAVQMLVSLVDLALWDLCGKITGMPVWRLAGGEGREVPCYASHGLFSGETDDQLEVSAHRLVEAGFKGVKLRIGRRPLADDVARARRVRDAVGPEASIMVDGLWSMSSSEAISFARAVEDLKIAWLEDPVAEGNVAELRRVRDNVAVPIASAERISSVAEFRRLLDADVLDVAILDVHHIGGPTSWLLCAALANERGISVAGHSAPSYSAQLVSAAENGLVVEYFPWWDELQGGAMTPDRGLFTMAGQPGWGMPLDKAAIDAYRERLEETVGVKR